MLSNKYECVECNKLFKGIKSLEYHKSICLFYNYKDKYLINLNLDKEHIKNIIRYYNSINCKSDIISQHQILKNIKIKYSLDRNNSLLYLYNLFLNNDKMYYNKYDIIMTISNITHYPFDTIYNIVSTYDMCANKIEF